MAVRPNYDKNLSLADIADKFDDVTGSIVVANVETESTTDRAGFQSSQSGLAPQGAKIAFNASATQWVMQGGNVTTTLGGAANTVLRGGARDWSTNLTMQRLKLLELRSTTEKLVLVYEAFDMLARPSTEVPGRTKGTGAGNSNDFRILLTLLWQ